METEKNSLQMQDITSTEYLKSFITEHHYIMYIVCYFCTSTKHYILRGITIIHNVQCIKSLELLIIASIVAIESALCGIITNTVHRSHFSEDLIFANFANEVLTVKLTSRESISALYCT